VNAIRVRFRTRSQFHFDHCVSASSVILSIYVIARSPAEAERYRGGAIEVDREIWRTEPDGQISAEIEGLKLIIRRSATCARYVILQSQGDGETCAGAMLSSGTEPTVHAAKMAAERAVARTAIMLGRRRRSVVHLEKLKTAGRYEMER
jgi:hypothetical protein